MSGKERLSKQYIGELGEQFVAQCLQERGWVVLHQRWSCRWGELDIIAQAPEPALQLIFVEVKVRSNGNWDQMGLLSITPQKQQKLILAAQSFLSENISLSSYVCRFDVALVKCQKKPRGSYQHDPRGLGLTTLQANSMSLEKEPNFVIQHYIQGAFDTA